MGDTEKGNSEMVQRIHSSFGTSSSSIPRQPTKVNHQLDIPQFSPNLIRGRHFSKLNQPLNGGDTGSKRAGVPPSHPSQIPPLSPYSQIPGSRPANPQMSAQNFNPGPTHSRSLSQPSSFFSFDSLPPLSPAPNRDHEAAMDDREAVGLVSNVLLPPSPSMKNNTFRCGENLHPRKAHRRSISDIPYGFNAMVQSSPSVLQPKISGGLERSVSGGESSDWAKMVKRESSMERGGDAHANERKSEGDLVDDLFSAYMNLDNIDALNSSEDKNSNGNRDDMDSSRASGTKTNGCNSSDNEAESSINESGSSHPKVGLSSSGEQREGIKRSAGGDIAPTSRHYRSVSMDSFMGKLNFDDESPKLPPSPGTRSGQLSPGNSIDGDTSAFSLEFGNGEFTGIELKKIMANDKLAEIALTDPKRVKRILANRQSAARSKERKMRYIQELEHKVQTLQTEATTLSAQLTLLQRDSMGLTNQNNELKFRLQAMEQQAQLRDALNEALTAEVRRLKLATGEHNGESDQYKVQSINSQMFHQLNLHQVNSHDDQQQSSSSRTAPKPESKE